MAPRRRRNLGEPLYAYNLDTSDETGNWEEWQMAPTGPVCSRTCGGGVMIETRVWSYYVYGYRCIELLAFLHISNIYETRIMYRHALVRREVARGQQRDTAHVIRLNVQIMRLISESSNAHNMMIHHLKENDMIGFHTWKLLENVN